MAIDNPPIYSGLIYNSAFFVEDTGGLSQAQANALYLRKTVPDTATAEETFNSGIKTDTIKPRTTSGCNLFNDATGNVISSSICPNNNSSSYGYNNSIVTVGESSKFMRIGGSMPSGSGNYILLGAANTQTTNIGIASDGDVGLLTGTNKIVIGGSTKTMTLKSSALTVNAPPTFIGNTLIIKDTAVSPTSIISLNPATSQPFLSFGNTVDNLSVFVNPAGSSDIQVQDSKTLNIATTSSNVTLNMGTGSRTNPVTHKYSDSNNAVIGSSVNLNNGTSNSSETNIHSGTSSAGIVKIGSATSSTTAVSIATRGASSANAVRIGNVTNTTYLDSDTITLGALGLTGSGAISLASGTNAAGAQVSIGSTSLTAVNIKGGQTNLETTTLNLNTNGTGNTLIGTSGGSNSITFNRPLTPAYNPSTLVAGQIGYTYSPTVTWTNFGDAEIASQSLPAGVYMVSWSIQTYGVFINNFLYISGVTLPTIYPRWPFAPTGLTNTNVCSGSIVSSFTTTSTLRMFNFAANTQTGAAALERVLYITRIA